MSRRLKLMVVSNDLLIGGVQRNIAGYFRGLDRERFEPHLALVCAGGPLVEVVQGLGVDVRIVRSIAKIGPAKWIRPSGVRRLARLMAELKIDVVQTRLFLGNTIGRLAAARARVPVVVAAEHSTYFGKTFLHRAIDRRLAEKCQRIVAVSRTVRDFTVEQEGIDQEKFTVIHNGLDMSQFERPRPRAEVRRDLGIGEGIPMLFSAARLIPDKRYADFMPTLSLIGKRAPEVMFVLAGEGPDRKNIEAAAERLGLRSRVMMLGERNDVPDLLSAADLFVLPSRREGLPTAVIEALAAGCPVVGHDLPQSAEVVENNSDGVLIDFDDREGVARMIADLLADPARRAALATAGRAKARERFTLDKMVSSYMDLYGELWGKIN